jgi:hypothetical protein
MASAGIIGDLAAVLAQSAAQQGRAGEAEAV